MPRVRFSVRTLLIAITIFAAVLAFAVQYGPHLIWRILHSGVSQGVVSVPAPPLVAGRVDEPLVNCQIGPVSFELPAAMSRSIAVQRGIGGRSIGFDDGKRTVTVILPSRDQQYLQQLIARFPEKKKLTFPRLYKEVVSAQSSDFSYGMSHRELAWHRWLLTTRAEISIDLGQIEFLEKPEIEGYLSQIGSIQAFAWSTVDNQWQGTIYFRPASDADWARHLCATFAVQGDPEVLKRLSDAELKSLIKFTPAPALPAAD